MFLTEIAVASEYIDTFKENDCSVSIPYAIKKYTIKKPFILMCLLLMLILHTIVSK